MHNIGLTLNIFGNRNKIKSLLLLTKKVELSVFKVFFKHVPFIHFMNSLVFGVITL